ncbi:MAG TPA: hypothetical protein VKT78_13030 [Fimbriimonadaceae bacterium]|nr:hypothetical protein [Fimbriimonadaceae bacterium]
MVLAIYLGLLLQSGQAAEPGAISFAEYAALFKRLLPRLSEAVHEKLHLSPELENEVLCISVHDVPKAEFLDKIAEAAGAQWRTRGSELWLYPDAEARKKLEEKGLAKRTLRIKKGIGEFEAKLRQYYKAERAVDVSSDPRRSELNLTLKLFRAIDPRDIAKIPPDSRVVYSTAPTSAQLPLPAECAAAAEANYRWNLTSASEEERKLPAKPLSKIDVIIERSHGFGWNDVGGLEMKTRGYDGGGAYLTQASSWRVWYENGYYWVDNGGEFGETHPLRAARGEQNQPLAVSPDSRVFYQLLYGGAGRADPAKVRAKNERLLHPNLVDPLSYAGELLSGTARVERQQLVACVPDELFRWTPEFWEYYGLPDPGAEDVLSALQADESSYAARTGNWLLVSPVSFNHSRVDRALLSKLTATVVESYDLTMDQRLTVARAGYAQPGTSFLVYLWLSAARTDLLELSSDWVVGRMVSEMTPEQLHAATASGIELRALSPECRYWANVFLNSNYSGRGLNLDRVPGVKVEDESPDPDAPETNPLVPADYRAEPTEAMPSGLTGAERVVIAMHSGRVLRPAPRAGEADGFGLRSGISATDLGNDFERISFESGEPKVQPGALLPAFKSIQVGEQRGFALRIYNRAGSYREGIFLFPVFTSAERYTMATLPKELRAEYDKAVEETKASNKAYLDDARKPDKP